MPGFPHRAPLLFALFVAISAFLPAPSGAQADASPPAQDGSGRFRLQSNLVVVPVVVRDAQGQPVEGLPRAGFRLWDSGKEQTISQFEEERSVASARLQHTAPGSNSPAAERFIALFFDDLNAPPEQIIHARDAAAALLSTMLTGRTRVAIITPQKVLADFTIDPQILHQALAAIRLDVRTQRAGLKVTDDQLPGLIENGVETTISFDLRPGEYRARAVVREANEQHIGAFSRAFTVSP